MLLLMYSPHVTLLIAAHMLCTSLAMATVPVRDKVLSCQPLRRHMNAFVKNYRPMNMAERQRRNDIKDLEAQASYTYNCNCEQRERLGPRHRVKFDMHSLRLYRSGYIAPKILHVYQRERINGIETQFHTSPSGNVARASCMPRDRVVEVSDRDDRQPLR